MTPETEKRLADIRYVLSLNLRINVVAAQFLLSIIDELLAENEKLRKPCPTSASS